MHQQGGASPAQFWPGPRACRCLRNANAMNWGRVPTRLFSGICFPLSPLPLPLQTCPPPPATCSFHEPITMPRLFFSSEPAGPANQAQMQQGRPFLCPEGPQVDRRKVGQSNLNSAPKGGGRPHRAIWLRVVSERDLPRAVESWWISETEQDTRTGRSNIGLRLPSWLSD